MFEILGFIAALAFMCMLSLAAGLTAINCLGDYNIGGVPNTAKDRMWTMVFLAIVATGWFFLFKNSPITLVVS